MRDWFDRRYNESGQFRGVVAIFGLMVIIGVTVGLFVAIQTLLTFLYGEQVAAALLCALFALVILIYIAVYVGKAIFIHKDQPPKSE